MESEQTLVHEHGHEQQDARERRAARVPRRLLARSPPELAAEETPALEQVVLGRYRLLERLGAGGFGVVWRAHDELLHREVAVKRVPLGPDGDRERATREALAAARLSHPAIVALYEASVVHDACYLISELVDGCTLAELIHEQELSDEEALAIGIALADALAHAHARGVIHRDIKPQNVLIPARAHSRAPAAKLTDFGGASLVGEDALTRTGDVLGTLAYMAPEQCEGGAVGEEADLYALALVLYEALSGSNPVRGPTPAATVRRIGTELEPLSRVRRDLPRELTDVLDDALLPDPDERGTLAELRETLEWTLEHLPRAGRALHLPRAERTLRRGGGAIRAAQTPLVTRIGPQMRATAVGRSGQPPASDDQAELAPGELPDRRRLALPRPAWLAAALLLAGWQASAGRPGVALLVLAALVPPLLLAGRTRGPGVGAGWLAALLAPVLGIAGLAGAFPAVAGQARRWRERALLGALGYWWLVLAEPLVGRPLWLGAPSSTPARGAWEGSVSTAAAHVIAPLLSAGVLLGAVLWAGAAVALPLIVRGRSAAVDLLAAAALATALVLCAPALDSGLAAHGAQPAGRGAVIGAILGGILAVAARALRGPV